MSKRSYGEDHPDLSGDTLTGDRDTLSHTLSPCYRLSNNLTPPTCGMHSDGDVGLVPTMRCGGKDATAEEAKLSAFGAGISDLVSLDEMKNELIKTPTSSVIHEDMLLLSDFPTGLVGKPETQNGIIIVSSLNLHNIYRSFINLFLSACSWGVFEKPTCMGCNLANICQVVVEIQSTLLGTHKGSIT
ncbi:hypothetical protein L873DRAFT_1787391 [Choiromyces venosus 120613-1]|uniref:Uncharacterized protein n=1 Tax=Choiromyces venosus 120613-1 TaxID=1336337 RepID=A0A3N4JX60_9PEZI|nr:hypothetical protein L873DRAFT_1787391 [Choiromyces venosus 120613-1]